MAEVFDPNLEEWSELRSLTQKRYASHVMHNVGGKLYVIGGLAKTNGSYFALNSVEAYDVTTNTWTNKSPMPTSRYGLTSAVLGNEIYVIGGNRIVNNRPTSALSLLEIYNTETDTWRTQAPLPIPIHNASAIAHDDKIYVFGGQNKDEIAIDSVQVYNPELDEWMLLNQMPSSRISAGTVSVGDSIFLFGGHDRSTSGVNFPDAVYEYNPHTDEWIERASIPTTRTQFGYAELEGKIYVIGGSTSGGSIVAINETFTPSFSEGESINPPSLGIQELVSLLEEIINTDIENHSQQNSYLAHVRQLLKFYEDEQVSAGLNQLAALQKKIDQDKQRGNISDELHGQLSEIILALSEQFAVLGAGNNDVPLITQVASPYPPESAVWADMLYADGRANYAGSCGSTIKQCGCALASFAMLGQSYGLEKGVDGSEAIPPNIDAWLLANRGYDAVGNIKWREAIKYFGVEKNGNILSYLTLDNDHATDQTLIDSYVQANKPVITKTRATNRDGSQFTHFVLSKGIFSDTYAINDPLWYNTETLDDDRSRAPWVQDYNNLISGGRLFSFQKSPRIVNRGVNIQIASPAEMVLRDSQGRRLGYDPVLLQRYEEIPNGTYYAQPSFYSEELSDSGEEPHIVKTVDVSDPENETYTLEVIGTGSGQYYLSAHVVASDGSSELVEKWVDTKVGQRDVYEIMIPGGDLDNGHGNEIGQCDEDNPGKRPVCQLTTD